MMTPIRAALTLLPLALAAALPAAARPWNDEGAETNALCEINSKTHSGMMSVRLSGDADHDFITSMVVQHQAAIDIARTELRYGDDPETRDLAAAIVAAQAKEIAAMNAWLAKHPAGEAMRRPGPMVRYLGPVLPGGDAAAGSE